MGLNCVAKFFPGFAGDEKLLLSYRDYRGALIEQRFDARCLLSRFEPNANAVKAGSVLS